MKIWNMRELNTKQKWFLSYFMVLFVPILICVSLWVQMQNTVNRERINMAYLRIENLTLQMEEKIAHHMADVSFFNQSTAVLAALELDNLISDAEQEMMNTLSDEIANYAAQKDTDNEMIFYLSRLDVIVTVEGAESPWDYWNRKLSGSNIKFSDWKMMISKVPIEEYTMYQITFHNEVGEEQQGILHTTMLSARNQSRYATLAVLDLESLRYDLEYCAVYNDMNEMVFRTHVFPRPLLEVLRHLDSGAILSHNGKRYMAVRRDSLNLGLRFVVFTELFDFLKQSLFYIIIILIGSLFCVCAIWYISGKNYTIIERALLKLRRFHNESGGETPLDTLIERMEEENRSQGQEIRKQKELFDALNIGRLMRGQVVAFKHIQENLSEENQLVFPSDRFAVFVIFIENYGVFSDLNGEGEMSAADIGITHFAVQNISKEIIYCQGNQVYFSDTDGIVTGLVSFGDEALTSNTDSLAESCREIQTLLKEKIAIQTTFALSNVYIGLPNIQTAYNQALKIAEYKYVLREELLLTPDNIVVTHDTRYGYTQEHEELLGSMLKMGNVSAATELLREILSLGDEHNLYCVRRLRYVIHHIAATLIRFCGATRTSDAVLLEVDFLETLENAENLETMQQMLLEAVERLCNDSRNNNFGSLIENVVRYINENYSDQNLSISKIAEHFSVHPTYISNVFKEQMGIGALEYIHIVRVGNSKDLLAKTDLYINEIAERVGYLNANTYIRVFKKLVEITPKTYRNIKKH